MPIHKVTAHDSFNGAVGVRLYSLVNDSELVAELSRRPRHVHRPKHPLPKPPPHRQQGEVGHVGSIVLGAGFNFGAGQMAGDFSVVCGNDLFDGGCLVRLLGRDDLADDRLNVGVAELDRHAETVAEFLKLGRTAEGRLAGSEDEHPAVELFAARFDDFLDLETAVTIVADELLDFIEHNQGAGQLAIDREGFAQGLKHIVNGDVLHVGELLRQ